MRWLNKVDLLATINNTTTATTTKLKSVDKLKMFTLVFKDLRISETKTCVTRKKLTVRKADHFWVC